MKKNKGFTLVELLAVIVVVLIVVTIAIPFILGIVEKARMGAFRDTAYGIARSGEYLSVNENERQTFYYLDYKQYNADNKKLDYRGQSPKIGTVLVEAASKQVALAIHSGTYCATKAADEAIVTVSKITLEECSTYYLEDPTIDPSDKQVKIPIFAGSSRRIVSDQNKIYYKTFYSVGYTGYLEQFSKTSYEYTIHLGNLPLPLKDIETVRVTEHYTFEKLEEFKTYIVRRNMGDVIWPGEAPKQIDLSQANIFYKHTATSNNMDVDDVIVECDETLCKASIEITVNNLNGINPNTFEEELIAYLPVKFTVEFNGESDTCIARTSLDKEAGVLAGTGATDNPYLIESVEDLVALSNNVNNGNTYSGKNITLAITLDLNNSKSYVDATTKTYGDINGNGIIEDLKTELTTGEGFKPIGNEIKKFSGKLAGNLNCINNLYVNRPTTSYIGLIGYNNGGTVTTLGINSVNITGLNYTGGIVGHNNGHLNEMNVRGNITGNNYVGLIAGYTDYATTARSIIVEGNVLGNDYVGGMIGYNYYSTNFRAVNVGGSVVGTGTNVGRNIGRNYLSDYFSTLALSSVTVNGNIINSPTPNNIHGATFNKIDDLNNLYLAELALDTYIGGDNDGNGYYWDINNSGKLVRKNTATDPLLFTLNGSGTAEDPYIISNYEDLKQVSLKLSSHYKLINDIDMTDNLHYMIGSFVNHFKGNINGNFKTIKNITINSPYASYLGFSGYNKDGRIRDLNIKNIIVNGSNYTGGIAGLHSGHFTEINVTGNITGNNYVGLMTGYADYGSTGRSIIVEGNVVGNDLVGGIVGYNYYSTNLRAINMGGTVVGTGTNVGRNMGRNYLSEYFSTLASASITVNGKTVVSSTPNNIHGVSFNNIDDLNNLYLAEYVFDTYIGGDNDGDGYYWDINNYGKLVQKNTTTDPLIFTLSGSGTAADPYLIGSYEELKQASLKLSAHYKLVNDIDMTNKLHYMIGSFANHFKGNFDGNFKTIKNLSISSPYTSYLGFVGYNKDGRIKGLNLEKVNITGANYLGSIVGFNDGHLNDINVTGKVIGNNYVGLMTGYTDYGTTLRNIIVEGNVSGNDYVGGLIGYNYYSTNLKAINKGGSIVGVGSNIGRNMGRNYIPNYINTAALSTTTLNGNSISSTSVDNKHGLDITLSDLETISPYTDRGFNFTDETQEYIWYLENGVAKFRKGNL
ncbi:MAG: prepilin-type N-terminal cleavage/methylation domain-containing protein [Bacilli bacterium]